MSQDTVFVYLRSNGRHTAREIVDGTGLTRCSVDKSLCILKNRWKMVKVVGMLKGNGRQADIYEAIA
jgi:hypothetical protein